MSRRVTLRWMARQKMAEKGMFVTTDLLPLLAERDIHLSRQYVHRLITKTPQRINVDVLAALCDILEVTPADLLVVETVQVEAAKPARVASAAGPGIGELRPARTQVRRPPGA